MDCALVRAPLLHPTELNKEFRSLLLRCDIDAIRSNPAYRFEINACVWDGGWYALHLAVICRCADMVRALIEMGADVNKPQLAARSLTPLAVATTPFHLCIREEGKRDIVSDVIIEIFLTNPATQVNYQTVEEALIHIGPEISDSLMCRIVLRCADEIKRRYAQTPAPMRSLARFAALNQQHSTLLALLACGVPVHDRWLSGNFIVFRDVVDDAIQRGDIAMLETLIAAGCDISSCADMIPRIMKLDKTVRDEMLRVLMRHGMRPNYRHVSDLCLLDSLSSGVIVLRQTHYNMGDIMKSLPIDRAAAYRKDPARPFVLASYSAAMIEAASPFYDIHDRCRHVMVDCFASLTVAHDLLLIGHDPFDFTESPQTREILRHAKAPWSTRTHLYLYSARFRQHIGFLAVAQYLTAIHMPDEMWKLVMSLTSRDGMHDIITEDRISSPLEFSDSPRMKAFRSNYILPK